MITPIEKVLKTRKYAEFQPINTLKVYEKAMKKVVKTKLDRFFNIMVYYLDNSQVSERSIHVKLQ